MLEEAYVSEGARSIPFRKKLHRLTRFLPSPLVVALCALLGGCGGPASTVFNQAAPLPPDTRVAYVTWDRPYGGAASAVGLRGTDGKESWRTVVGANPDTAVYNGILYIGATPDLTTPTPQPPSSAFILALRLSDGTVLWRASLPQVEYVVNLTTGGATVLAATEGGGLYALDPSNGAVRWHIPAYVIGPAQMAGDVVVVSVGADQPPNDQAAIAAYRKSDGALLWRKDYSTPIFTNHLAIYATVGDYTVALSAQDGYTLWTYQPGDMVDHPSSQVIKAGDQVVLVQVVFPVYSNTAPSKDYLAALDARTGQVKWEFSPGFEDVSADRTPLFAATSDATTIYGVYNRLSSGKYHNTLTALRGADGVKLWQTDFFPNYLSQLSSADGVLFALLSPQLSSPICFMGPCVDGSKRLQAIDGANGTVYWERDLPDAMVLAQVSVAGST